VLDRLLSFFKRKDTIMIMTRHVFRGEADMPHILDLVRRMPLTCRHVIDLPWRLSSPTINEGRDAAFWKDADGQVVGFVAWQYYWAALDFFILPGPQQQAVETEIFTWADGRFRELDEERGQPLAFPYWVEFRDDDQARRHVVEAHGFLFDEDDRYVLLQHSLTDLSSVPALPDGFTLRPLAGEQEAAAYAELHRAAFESTSMTPEWRARTIRMPQYRPELDLVVCAPDGSLAGFCVGWFEPARNVAQVEPLGVHPRFHQLGLGRVLLLEMLRRFKEHGAESAFVETDLDRTPARRAYESVGFQQVHTIRRKGKWVNQPV
jgi:ribosomal protein S18 acetylase RimI-like enzyme